MDYIPSDMTIHETFLLGWSAKWMDGDEIMSDVLTGPEALQHNDLRVVESLAELIREADIIVAHNIDRFDLPMFNNRLMLLGLEPLAPVRTLDTRALAHRSFRLMHNKLTWLARALGLGDKLPTDFMLWENCYHGDEIALAEMQEYNKHDVVLLEQVFWHMYPYLRGLPRMVEATVDGELICQYCGSGDVQKRGTKRTNAGTYQAYQCNACRRYSSSPTAEKPKSGLRPLP
jgi:hypothetical protein